MVKFIVRAHVWDDSLRAAFGKEPAQVELVDLEELAQLIAEHGRASISRPVDKEKPWGILFENDYD